MTHRPNRVEFAYELIGHTPWCACTASFPKAPPPSS